MLVRSILLLFLTVAAGGVQERGPILVSAAISLTDALQEIAAAYERAGNAPVRFNFAGSNVLARQIVNGAPADVFISADELQMDHAQHNGAVDAATRFDLLKNHLVVVVPTGRPGLTDATALLSLTRIAVADPAAVPAGVYARQYLTNVGLWERIQPKLLPLANVRAALVAAESGGADAAIVYESDAVSSKKVAVAFRVTGAVAPRIVYPAAIVSRSSRKSAASTFLAFLRSAEARAIFEKYRFIPAGG